MKTKQYLKIIAPAVVAGIFAGWLLFHNSGETTSQNEGTELAEHEQHDETTWTCSMHPQIRQDEPGKCPICGMDLIPLEEAGGDEATVSPDAIQMTEAARQLANIQTTVVQKAQAIRDIHLLGKVQADERNIAQLTARYGGRIEKLFVNFTGERVKKGENLARIYSPGLVSAQKELLEAMKHKESNPSFYQAARQKLKLWDLTEEQIRKIENNAEPQHYFNVAAPISGTVTQRNVSTGDYIKEGSALFEVTDLSRLWVMFEAYESDLPWLNVGDKVSFTIKAMPGQKMEGKISFIDPVIHPDTRVAKVRAVINNPEGKLKPGMFVDGVIQADLSKNQKDLMIPKTALLWTGKRSLVYVKTPHSDQPSFLPREITLGPEAGSQYVVEEGLEEGEEIAVNGVFKIDAAAQLAGKPSMMNPEGGEVSTGHDHDDMEMEASHEINPQQSKQLAKTHVINKTFRRQLKQVYDAYLPMKDALVNSDVEAVQKRAGEVKKSLQSVNMGLLEGEAHMDWMEQLEVLNKQLDKIGESNRLETQREAFIGFNDAFYKSLKQFGLSDGEVYYQYCPMAKDNRGAYWLSSDKEIRNPYFGEAMLSCGETRETMEFGGE